VRFEALEIKMKKERAVSIRTLHSAFFCPRKKQKYRSRSDKKSAERNKKQGTFLKTAARDRKHATYPINGFSPASRTESVHQTPRTHLFL
jgi:hypothetical protein